MHFVYFLTSHVIVQRYERELERRIIYFSIQNFDQSPGSVDES